MKIIEAVTPAVKSYHPNGSYQEVWYKWHGVIFQVIMERKDCFCMADFQQYTVMEIEHIGEDTAYINPAHNMSPKHRSEKRLDDMRRIREKKNNTKAELDALLGSETTFEKNKKPQIPTGGETSE